ncbi:hypothetical protein ACFWMQ_05855 [Streptomyces sp. NPDC058372]|uniref:hypothetical protein n=1 Tax=Streptomyces sp. NPDC058372 TaxID=3346464 RepID=UPI00364FAC40
MTSLGRARKAAPRTTALCAGLLAGITALTGCSSPDPDEGTNGVGKLSAAQIHAKAKKAAAASVTVRLTGSLISEGETFKLDMRLKKNGGLGKVTSKNGEFQLMRVGEQLFLKARADFWTHDKGGDKPTGADSEAADKLDGMFVKVPEGDPAYKQLTTFTDKDVLLGGLLTLHGKVATGDRGSVGGVRTIAVSGDSGAGGTLDVSLEGTAYPLRLTRAGDAGALRMSDWNQAFSLKAPAEDEMVDYGRELPSD